MIVHENKDYWFVWCVGCNDKHLIPKAPSENGAKWDYNGNKDKPTFTPSVKISWPEYRPGDQDHKPSGMNVCHFNITAGKMIHHGDSTHNMAGKTVEMTDFDLPPGYL